jgi:2-hydroxychromene-2-carboxylate isomerase
MSGKPAIDYYFEFSSPYSYLAANQLDWVFQQTGAEINIKPMVLGAVFKEQGNAMPASVPAKGKYMFTDLKRWAARYQMPFRWPSVFPVNSILGHRAVLVAQRELDRQQAKQVMLTIYHSYWVEGIDIGDADELFAELDGAGFDAAKIIQGTQDPDIKQQLKDLTAEAIDRGVFGAPTFFVEDQMFWGNDRLDFLVEAYKAL